jgi:plasmid stabilization system protein ParE
MAALKVFWTQTAIRQRNFIFEYWNLRNKSNEYSKKLLSKIIEYLDVLKQNPEIGRATKSKNIRGISLGHYSIYYKHTTTQITIVAFWDNRQEPVKLLNFIKE